MPFFNALPFGGPLTPEDWSDRGIEDPLGRLWRQHTLLRAALARFATACEGEDVQEASTACERLAGLLRLHIRQEGQLAIRSCQQLGRLGREELDQLAVEHYTEQKYLRVTHRCLAGRSNVHWRSIRFPAQQAAAELRRHLDEQERGLFPLLASALSQDARHPQRSSGLNRLVPVPVPVPLRLRWPSPGRLP